MSIDVQTIRQARSDVGTFARALVGEALWKHQLEVARSSARIRCICSGRRAGKSRTLAILSLFEAFTRPDARVLIISATEDAAKNLLAEIAQLLSAPILRGSSLEENRSRILLSNGSEIVSVPASERQIRGRGASLLIIDEAAFVPEEIWQAARYTVLTYPDSRIVMASTPYGLKDKFFAVAYRAGERSFLRKPSGGYESFHWPSTVSPLVDHELLAMWRESSTDREYRMEVLAEWVDEAGAFYTSDELEHNVADYRLTDPGLAFGQQVCGGVDWAFSRDASTLALIGVLADGACNRERHPRRAVFFLPWLEEHYRLGFAAFVDRIVKVAERSAGFHVRILASETNGVGMAPTQSLKASALAAGTRMAVAAVHTDSRRKESGFGALKLLLQQGRLVLPRHPGLLRQLAALERETSEAGNVKIAVPERAGHDDLAMALMQAASCLQLDTGRPALEGWGEAEGAGELLETANGVRILERPRALAGAPAYRWPRGSEKSDGW